MAVFSLCLYMVFFLYLCVLVSFYEIGLGPTLMILILSLSLIAKVSLGKQDVLSHLDK